MVIYAAHVGTNADVFPSILQLYVPEGSRILDCTYGKGVFWQKVDKQKFYLDFTDWNFGCDARDLYFYQDGSKDCIVFDPPYAHDSKTFGGAQYNNRACTATQKGGHQAVLDFYLTAAKEHHRILRSKGIYIIKCQDEVCGGKQCPTHSELINALPKMGFEYLDSFVVVQTGKPSTARWKQQLHARKNHSYFLVFRRGCTSDTKGKRGKHMPKPLAFFQNAGARGGRKAAAAMTSQQRLARARKAAEARWNK